MSATASHTQSTKKVAETDNITTTAAAEKHQKKKTTVRRKKISEQPLEE